MGISRDVTGPQRLRPLQARRAGVTPGCQTCGRWPAMSVKFRQCTGVVLAVRIETFTGRYCRDCAMATFRRTTARTLVAGWWGLFAFFANWYVLATNVWQYRRVLDLGRPR